MAYITQEEARSFARTELADDLPLLVRAMAAAEAAVNEWCQRTFVEPTGTTVRLFVPDRCSPVLRVDDIASDNGLVILNDGAAVAAATYQLEVSLGVVNQTTRAGEARPYGYVRLLDGLWTIDGERATVSITARWGWPATPEAVKLATLVLTRDFLLSRDVLFGMATFGADGFTRRVGETSTVVALLEPYRTDETFGVA